MTSGDVIVGRVIQAHGVSGRVRVQVLSDVPHRFDTGQLLNIGFGSFRITDSSPTGFDQVLLELSGISSRDQAQALVGLEITVPETAARAMREGEYFHFQLLGLRVLTEDEELLGEITEILETGSNDVYVVSGSGRDVLVPALVDVVKDVRLDEGVMIVDLPDGLR